MTLRVVQIVGKERLRESFYGVFRFIAEVGAVMPKAVKLLAGGKRSATTTTTSGKGTCVKTEMAHAKTQRKKGQTPQ